MPELKLIALDSEDLTVISAHLQDAVARVGDLTFLEVDKRFVSIFNRFDWLDESDQAMAQKGEYVRRQAGLRFDQVTRAMVSGIDLTQKDQILSLLSISFEQTDKPSGIITFNFSGEAGIKLHVNYIEAELKDLGAAWTTKNQPKHPESE